MAARLAARAVALLTLCLATVGCVAHSAPVPGSSVPEAGPVATTPSPQETPQPTTQASGDFLGCHEFCMQAGGLGGGEPIPRSDNNISIFAGDTRAIGGYLPVTITCTKDDPCRGWILIMASFTDNAVELGRSDLLVPGHSTRVIAVLVAKDMLQKLNEVTKVPGLIVAYYGDPTCPSSGAGGAGCVVEATVNIYAQ